MFKKWLICTFLIIYSFTFGYSEQVVVSQLNIGLLKSSDSEKYTLEGKNISVSDSDKVTAVTINNDTLSNSLDFKITKGAEFTNKGVTTKSTADGVINVTSLEYSGNSVKGLVIPVKRNQDTVNAVTGGAFQLSTITKEAEESVTSYIIQEGFTLPAKSIELKAASSNTGNKFTYIEGGTVANQKTIRKNNLKYYKTQEYMIRIARVGVNTDYDLLGNKNTRILLANYTEGSEDYSQKFLNGANNYMDFWVEGNQYEKDQCIETKSGTGLKFKPGNIEVFGLPAGSYRIELYSFKYCQDNESEGSVVITKESSLAFTSGNFKPESSINLLSFSSKEFTTNNPLINATLLVVSNTSSPAFDVQEACNSVTKSGITITSKSAIEVTEVYMNADSGTSSVPIIIDDKVTGYDNETNLYYKKYRIQYKSPFIEINNYERTVNFNLTVGGTDVASTSYIVKPNVDEISGNPYQTVFIKFSENKSWADTFEISDDNMNKYTGGYKGVRTASDTAIETLYKGYSTLGNEMTINTSYDWVGTGSNNSLIIKKIPSDSKASITGTSATFYTTTWTPNLTYTEKGVMTDTATDSANFTWSSPDRSSFNITANEEKVIFRIVKTSSNTGQYLYSPYENAYPIVATNEVNLNNFLDGSNQYFDLIFESGQDKITTLGDCEFSFSKNNGLRITGLATGTYQLQIYSLQDEDSNTKSNSSYDYKVLTYGGLANANFIIGIPELAKDTFSKTNNVFTIDSITVNSLLENDKPVKKVQVGLVIKADEDINENTVNSNNLTAQNYEEESTTDGTIKKAAKDTTSGVDKKVTEARNAILSDIKGASNITLTKSSKSDFQYPLDIVLLIDNSASMQNEVNQIKSGLKTFASSLVSKGYNVKFNLIVFGAIQNKDYQNSDGININKKTGEGYPIKDWVSRYNDGNGDLKFISDDKKNQIAIFKNNSSDINKRWFGTTVDDSGLSELETAFDNIQCVSGYSGSEENGAGAIYYGTQMLNNNGRYLNNKLKIVSHDSSEKNVNLPSKKWMILLTDENMDKDKVANYDSTFTATNVVDKLSDLLASGGITLTGIYHTSFVSDKNDVTTYNTLSPTVSSGTIDLYNYRAPYFQIEKDLVNNVYFFTYTDGEKYYVKTTNTENSNLPGDTTNLKTTESVSSSKNYYAYDTQEAKHYPITLNGSKYIYTFKDARGVEGTRPADHDDIFYTDFAINSKSKNLFYMYDMGTNGENVGDSLAHAVKNIGIIQRWNLSYDSSFTESDGLKREVITSLTGIKRSNGTALDLSSVVSSGTRFYTVPLEKIESSFTNPVKITETDGEISYYLVSKNGNISLEAVARSQYRKDGVLYNYPIRKGSFIISDSKGNELISNGIDFPSATLKSYATASGALWYRANATLSVKDFKDKFGKNATVTVKFTAESDESIKTITVSNVTLVEKDSPKITNISMTNITLADFMKGLKTNSTTRTFTDDAITGTSGAAVSVQTPTTAETTSSSGITAITKQLNVKDGDRAKLEFTVDDESIFVNTVDGVTTQYGTVQVLYNGITYTATYRGVDGDSDSTKTKWEVTIPAYVKNTFDITFNIIDSSKYKNGNNLNGIVFNEPALLDNTNFAARSAIESTPYYNPAGNYTNFYNTAVDVADEVANTLGYIVVFNYNTSNVDSGAPTSTYSTDNGLNWAAIGNNNFPTVMNGQFAFGDGKYLYNGKVYAINAAGAIKEITSSTVNTISTIVSGIGVPSGESVPSFYVDTVKPKVSSLVLTKTADLNNELNSGIANSIVNGVISEEIAYKAGDTLSLSATIVEKNLAKMKFNDSNSINIFTDTTMGTLTGTSYTKSGEASDYNGISNQGLDNSSLNVKVYDKAGNIAKNLSGVDGIETSRPLDLVKIYDDGEPSTLITENFSLINEVTAKHKYTNDLSLPLTKSNTKNTVPLSVVRIGSIYGDVRAVIGSLGEYGYPVQDNQLNSIGYIFTYSYSGVKVSENDSIVHDNKINDDRTILTEVSPIRLGNNKYKVNLNKVFSTVKELVGLNKFEILNTNISGVNGLEIEGTIPRGEHLLFGAGYFLNPIASNVTAASNGNYYMTFTTALRGNIDFSMIITDRLGNPKPITYTVQIPNDVSIIGKKTGSGLEIKTQINANGQMKIKSRTE